MRKQSLEVHTKKCLQVHIKLLPVVPTRAGRVAVAETPVRECCFAWGLDQVE